MCFASVNLQTVQDIGAKHAFGYLWKIIEHPHGAKSHCLLHAISLATLAVAFANKAK